jgi:hypothetical protein
MFNIPEGAKVWALDAEPILELKDGSTVWATKPNLRVPLETFVRADPAIKGDFDYWRRRYEKPD